MLTRWAIIQASVNMFHGFHSEVENRGDRGINIGGVFDKAMDMYRKHSEGHKSFAMMHCYSKLKKNENDGCPIGNKATKAALADTTSIEKTQGSITQCLAKVSSTLLFRDKKTDKRWAALLKRQEEKIELKKRKDDMSLLTASTEGMSPRTRVTHNFFKGQIIGDIEAKMAAAEAAAATPTPEQEPADASATTYAIAPASASASASATEHAHRTDHDEFVVIDGPTSTQDAPLVSRNPFPFF
ncbi:hypothetical protein QYE76_014401 [Lolium multiflorum]|uniref:No apical meristem-associated C-terminal domain-containing protein n=1 Tax=Lolium multiflorum TaxID=4521 RepID=A0AAD8U4P0_LOLMU|nr:hypothetical protein QYE76_014401 [Lolium multiflorum]